MHWPPAPTGHVYYHHAGTNQSTYVRPIPTFANMNAMQSTASSVPKKDKPLVKTPIPGTEWIRVKTTQGNIFYNNKSTKASVWVMPEEIKDAVRALEEEEAAQASAEHQKQLDMEVERIKGEVEGTVAKRKADDAPAANSTATKKPKTSAPDDEEEDEDAESEEEDWQREAAAQLAAEAEAEERRKAEERERQAEEKRKAQLEMEEKAAKLNLPRREDLSIEEAKALFKVHILASKVLYGTQCFLDPAPRKGHQSSSPMGYLTSPLRF
jgi:transcription elongation regulator 1